MHQSGTQEARRRGRLERQDWGTQEKEDGEERVRGKTFGGRG